MQNLLCVWNDIISPKIPNDNNKDIIYQEQTFTRTSNTITTTLEGILSDWSEAQQTMDNNNNINTIIIQQEDQEEFDENITEGKIRKSEKYSNDT